MILARMTELARDLWTRPGKAGPMETHLGEALSWLYRAQDATGDRGVSHSFEIGKGWLPSYPETTGYIIPTLLNCWMVFGNEEAKRRALDMARWELGVQLETGAIPSLADGQPVVFDTGQVLFGWVAAYEATDDDRYLRAALRAGDWLLETQGEDGAWREATSATSGITYNARTAWALLELSRSAEDERYRTGAERFLAWSLSQEAGRGWFEHNCLNDNARPLLHTIAYTARGQLEGGLLLESPDLVAAASRTARELVAQVGPDGRMPGRYDRDWKPAVSWVCLTGMAQTVLLWTRLARVSRDMALAAAADKAMEFLKATQDLNSRNPGLRGGIRGSFPVNGAYCRYRLPNWATKFFIDAVIQTSAPDPAKAVFKG